ncbi:MAG: 50S ribosomal protein L11 methyltransferase [Hyphomicrobium sp.]
MGRIETNIVALEETRRLLRAGMDYHSAGKFAEAESAYLAVLDHGYRIADVLPLVAGLASARGDLLAALEHWTKLLDLQPSHIFGLCEKGSLLHRLGRWTEAVEPLEAAYQVEPCNLNLLANLGVALTDAGRLDDALIAFRRLQELDPGNMLVQHLVRRTASAIVPYWHIPMLNDQARNDAFENAIRMAVSVRGSDARVLDIGAGSGLLSMMAARAGAKSVVCCESVPVIAETAAKIVAKNGYEDRIRVIAKRSNRLVIGEDMEERADILISEILSSDLLSEHVLATFEDAHARLVREDATVIPRAVTARGCLIESEVLAKYAFVNSVSGFDVGPFTALAAQRLPVHGKITSWRKLSDDQDLVHVDLKARRHDSGGRRLSIPVTSDGIAIGVMQWLHVDVAEGVEFVNSPEEYCDGGWLQLLHTFPGPVSVRAGETFELEVGHDRSSLMILPCAR